MFLKAKRRKGARPNSCGGAFHKEGATAEQIQLLVVVFQASQGVNIHRYMVSEDLVRQAVEPGRRCSDG